MGLLAAEITARTGSDPHQFYTSLTNEMGESFYARIDAAASREQKALLANLDPAHIDIRELAGEPIDSKLTRAPGNNQAIGGIKLVTKSGWFAARPSGTEDVYKIYAESFCSKVHLKLIQDEAQALITHLFSKA
jgi:phosphoglucomutase